MDVSGCQWMELPTIGCQWMSVDVSGYQWMSVDVSGCVNVIFVYQLSFSAYEHHSWLKTVHYMQCANCRSQPSFSAMKQPSPGGTARVSDQNYLHELIDKVSILEMQAGDHKIRSDDLSKWPSNYCLINFYKRCVSSNLLSLWVLFRTEESPLHAKSKL